MDCLAPEKILGFVDGSLAGEERASVESHIDLCRSCRLALSEAGRQRAAGARDVSGLSPVLTSRSEDRAMAGILVGRYQLGEAIGEGAMGTVYRAHDPQLGRDVAIKIMHPRADDPALEALVRERTLREGRAIAKIASDNVVSIFDVGVWERGVFVAMELIEGETLAEWLQGQIRAPHDILRHFRACALGLAAAHRASVVHRDFKPSNVLMATDGRVRVSDFGLALAEGADELVLGAGEDAGPLRITCTGALLGTPAYMAPEQLRRERPDGRADQFALCVALWQAIYGERPFRGKTAAELLANIDSKNFFDTPRRGPSWLRAVLMKGLASNPDDRHRDMETLASALRQRRTPLALIGMASVMALAIATFFLAGDTAESPCRSLENPLHGPLEQARASIEALASSADAPGAAVPRQSAISKLDRYAGTFAAMQRQTCEAARASSITAETSEKRLACLDGARQEFLAALAILTGGKVDDLREAAPRLVASLPAPEACASLQSWEPSPAQDPAVRERDRELVGIIAEARALRIAGQAQASLARLEEIVDRGEELQHARQHARAHLAISMCQRELGDFKAARASLTRAAALAERASDRRLKAQAWVRLLEVAGDEAVEMDDAEQALTLARSAVEGMGRDPGLEGEFAVAHGRLLLRQGKFEEARDVLLASLSVPDLVPLEESSRRNVLATAHSALRDYPSMLAELETSLALLEDNYGTEHPAVANIYNNMVEARFHVNGAQSAIESAEKARDIFERNYGDDDPRVGAALDNLSILYAMTGDMRKAIAISKRALDLQIRRIGPDHADIATTELNLGSMYADAGQPEAALEHLLRATEIWERTLGPEHPDIARALLKRAKVHREQKQLPEALPLAERALAIRLGTQTPPAYLAHTRFALAQILAGLHRQHARSRRLAREALETFRKLDDQDEMISEIEAWLAL